MLKRLSLTICLFLIICNVLGGCSTPPNNSSQSTQIGKESTPLSTESGNVTTELTNEEKGVPDSVVLRNTTYAPDFVDYEVNHNVDTAAHIDDLKLVLHYAGNYGTKTITIPYTYQYDKGSDLWTLLHSGDGVGKHYINKTSYIDNSPFTGEKSTFSYSISFHEIDTAQMTATISYDITFKHKNTVISGKKTVPIIESGGTFNSHFLIEYTEESFLGYTKENLWFWFNIDTGISAL